MNARGQRCVVTFSPQGYFTQVPSGKVQDELRQCFRQWGRPVSLRVDNGYPWGSCGDLPTPLALWLVGLDIGVIWNPPRRPQDNGVVERSQGLAKSWAEPDRCHDPAELQRRLNEEDQVQRRSYPHGSFGSRMEAYPDLAHSARPYGAAWEREHWSWAAVLSYLAEAMVHRQVDRCGKLGLYHGKLYVGTVNRAKQVVLQFDPETVEWVISDPSGVELCRRELDQFDEARLRRLPIGLSYEPIYRIHDMLIIVCPKGSAKHCVAISRETWCRVTVTEQALADGSIKLSIRVGGGA